MEILGGNSCHVFDRVVTVDFSKKVIFKQRFEGREGESKVFLEGKHSGRTARAKTLRQEHVWSVSGTARRTMCLDWSEQGGQGKNEVREGMMPNHISLSIL